jgi:hypothetical protein
VVGMEGGVDGGAGAGAGVLDFSIIITFDGQK